MALKQYIKYYLTLQTNQDHIATKLPPTKCKKILIIPKPRYNQLLVSTKTGFLEHNTLLVVTINYLTKTGFFEQKINLITKINQYYKNSLNIKFKLNQNTFSIA